MKIVFDKRGVKRLGIVTIISFVLFLVGVYVVESPPDKADLNQSTPFMYMSLYFFTCMFLVTLIAYIFGKIYLFRLKKYGYEIPADKREYDNDLSNLPRNDKIYNAYFSNEETSYKWSFLLSLICMIGFVVCLAVNIVFYFQWKFLESAIGAYIGQLVFYDLFWLACSIHFFRQSDNLKFRDPLELDDKRKKRIVFPHGIILLVILICFTIGIKTQATQSIYSVLGAYESEDLGVLNNIRAVVAEEYKIDPTAFSSDDFIITDMDKPEGEFWTNVANKLEIKSFKELAKKIRVADGVAKIAVRADEDGVVIIELKNPEKRVKTEMILGE
ncbi:MAG: hypothetical protein K5656_04000 [Lachnospiraceae bacterium]|nr:hypothetical protein [Lachnospiraceae bacterium]